MLFSLAEYAVSVNIFDSKKKPKQDKLEKAFVKILDYVEITRSR